MQKKKISEHHMFNYYLKRRCRRDWKHVEQSIRKNDAVKSREKYIRKSGNNEKMKFYCWLIKWHWWHVRYCQNGALLLSATGWSTDSSDQVMSVKKYLMKSDGFYCLKDDGSKDDTAAVHYFDHVKIDGTVFDGFYYHDESGCFQAGSSHMVKPSKLSYQKIQIMQKSQWIWRILYQ